MAELKKKIWDVLISAYDGKNRKKVTDAISNLLGRKVECKYDRSTKRFLVYACRSEMEKIRGSEEVTQSIYS